MNGKTSGGTASISWGTESPVCLSWASWVFCWCRGNGLVAGVNKWNVQNTNAKLTASSRLVVENFDVFSLTNKSRVCRVGVVNDVINNLCTHAFYFCSLYTSKDNMSIGHKTQTRFCLSGPFFQNCSRLGCLGYSQGDHSFRKIIFHDFSTTFQDQPKWISMSYRHYIFSGNTRNMTYE